MTKHSSEKHHCEWVMTKGIHMGQTCSRPTPENWKYCVVHQKVDENRQKYNLPLKDESKTSLGNNLEYKQHQ